MPHGEETKGIRHRQIDVITGGELNTRGAEPIDGSRPQPSAPFIENTIARDVINPGTMFCPVTLQVGFGLLSVRGDKNQENLMLELGCVLQVG